MTEKLAAWRQEKKRGKQGVGGGSENAGGNMVNRRPQSQRKKKKMVVMSPAFSASSSANGENVRASAPNSTRKSGNQKNKFGWKKPTPSKIAKRKVMGEAGGSGSSGRRVLTPVQKKSCTPVRGNSTSMQDIVAKLAPWTEKALALVDRKVCKGLRRHELVKRVKKLQSHVLDTRKSYSEYIGQVKALLELCVERERVLANDTAEFEEQNEALRAAREDLEHTIYNLREEQKTHVRNISEMIDSKTALKQQHDEAQAKVANLTELLREATDGQAAAQVQIGQLTADLEAKSAEFQSLQAELQQAREEFAAETEKVRAEQDQRRQAAQEAMDATVADVKARLAEESTKSQVGFAVGWLR